MMNNEDFVSYEIAQALKKAGFDWECHEFWDTSLCDDGTPIKIRKTTQEPRTCVMSERNSILESIGSDLITAPTMAQAQKWLREVKDCVVLAKPQIEDIVDYTLTGKWYYEVWIDDNIFGASDTKDIYFDTYESALSAGIEAALELIWEGER